VSDNEVPIWGSEAAFKPHLGKILKKAFQPKSDPGFVVLEFMSIEDAIPNSNTKKIVEDRRLKELPRFIERDLEFSLEMSGEFLVVANEPDDLVSLREQLLDRTIDAVNDGKYKGVPCTIIKLTPIKKSAVCASIPKFWSKQLMTLEEQHEFIELMKTRKQLTQGQYERCAEMVFEMVERRMNSQEKQTESPADGSTD